MLKIISPILLIVFLFGCAGIETRPAQFKINIAAMKPLQSTLMEQRYQVDLRIMNRSNEEFSIDGFSFDVELNGKDFASGVSNEAFNLPALSEKVVSVEITSTIFGLVRQFNSFQKLNTEPFKYELSGSVYTRGSLFGIKFNEQGEINLK
ncbi:LEA type 2 family protein [sulfur-oxidizing endosymbiont of Gigantopelta aegis]|uniref:LEA type 2 family protein n=1 Tax=sulfur-oxidizing endosymbiont of Gigantopelta aegis TaxID=2794934 RepID=UPI001BE44D11|nr:LEA type 2 family protein [sulfur-oxidizing endosymbiont of Gigantopelta aegis]